MLILVQVLYYAIKDIFLYLTYMYHRNHCFLAIKVYKFGIDHVNIIFDHVIFSHVTFLGHLKIVYFSNGNILCCFYKFQVADMFIF